jgi:hypothetical protein
MAHINRVRQLVGVVVDDLRTRAFEHDRSKLQSPEKEAFDAITPRLRDVEYGSEEYRATMREFRPAIEHHQQNNDHHPEYFGDEGIAGMNLIQLTEMLCDWKAAGERHEDGGDLYRSIEINQQRFGYDDGIRRLLENTADWLEGK